MSYSPTNKVRIVTAASLFDGHDAAINIMRRIMQSKGAEIIHLGHNRSVKDIVETAIEEDVQGIAITSYQGDRGGIAPNCNLKTRYRDGRDCHWVVVVHVTHGRDGDGRDDVQRERHVIRHARPTAF